MKQLRELLFRALEHCLKLWICLLKKTTRLPIRDRHKDDGHPVAKDGVVRSRRQTVEQQAGQANKDGLALGLRRELPYQSERREKSEITQIHEFGRTHMDNQSTQSRIAWLNNYQLRGSFPT